MIPFADYCAQVERHIETTYSVPVIHRDVPDPLLGDLNGAEIVVDFAVTPEQRLFLLAHLFGHTVQWNLQPEAFELGRPQRPPVREDDLPQLMAYEREAACYGLRLLHEAGIQGLDQWFADYAACDREYLGYYYQTGEKREFLSFWRSETALVEAKRVPRFAPERRIFRADGIVI